MIRLFIFFIFYFFSVLTYASSDEIVQKLKSDMPDSKVLFIKDYQSDELGTLHIITINDHLFFLSEKGTMLFSGDVVDLKRKINIKSSVRDFLARSLLKEIPQSDLISFKSNNEKHEIFAFFDPFCGYCKKMYHQLNEYLDQGISINLVLISIHPQQSPSTKMINSIWCYDDHKIALDELITNKTLEQKNCDHPILRNLTIADQIGLKGTPLILDKNGVKYPGYHSPESLIKKLN